MTEIRGRDIKIGLSRAYLEAMRNMATVVAYSASGGFVAAHPVFGSRTLGMAIGVFLWLIGIVGAQSAYAIFNDAIMSVRPKSHWAIDICAFALAFLMTGVPWLVLNGTFSR